MERLAEPPTSAVSILATAAVLGVLGDFLFNGAGGLGINGALWLLALAAAATLHARRQGGHLPDRWLLTALGLGLCLAWRDAEFLKVFDVLGILLALSLTGMQLRVEPRRGRLLDYVSSSLTGAASAAGGAVLVLAKDGGAAELNRRIPSRGVGAVVKGLLLAAPIALVFGSLFVVADPQLGSFLGVLVDWDVANAVGHVMLALALAWLAAGLIRGSLTGPSLLPKDLPQPSITPVAAGIALGTMVLLFLLFVASQSTYLFADAALIESRSGLTFANHARQGFFEMVAASALSLPVLYGSEVLVHAPSDRARQSLRAMGSVQLMLTGLVMASALQRFGLYISAYGLTEDRIIGVAVISWLAFVTVWFGLTVLRGRAERFTFGAMVSGFTVLALLNVTNPEAIIARVNTDRATRGLEVDREHLARLSADAAPVLVPWLAGQSAGERCKLGQRLREKWNRERDWRSWNRSVSRATVEARRLSIDDCTQASSSE